QPFAPWMIRPRADPAPGCRDLGGPFPLCLGACRNDVIGEASALVGELQRPIQSFFHLHVCGPNRVVNLIELPLMRDGEVVAPAASRLAAEDTIEGLPRRTRPMQIH